MLHPQTFAASFFFLTGYAFDEYKVSRFTITQSLLGLFATFVGSFFYFMEMGDAFYDNNRFLPYLTTAIIATWSLKSLFERWSEQPNWLRLFLSFASKNTITILAFHFFAFKLVSYLIVMSNGMPVGMVAEYPVINGFAETGWWMAYLFVGIAVPLGFAYIKRILLKHVISR